MNERFSINKKAVFTVLLSTIIMVLGFLFVFSIVTGNASAFFKKFWQNIAPITAGFIIAYLSNPIVIFYERRVFKWINGFKPRRFISILFAFLSLFLFVSIILILLIPSLINTLISFWDTYIVNYQDAIRGWVNSFNSAIAKSKLFNSTNHLNPESIISWVQTKLPWIDDMATGDLEALLPNVTNSISHNISAILEYVFSFGASVFNFIKNFIFGIFIAFYMLMAKEKFKAYLRRLLNSFLSPKNVRSVVRFGKLVDRSFGGFIEGQLLDAIVVGIMSFFIFLIFGIPAPHLLATIIGVTNVIPVFGPFIGGIPASFIVLLTSPHQTILFILLIILIQQIDGNILCPHIIGDKINISSLATIIAIVTMGGLFGILGMIIGVPIFAVAIHIINDYTMNALRKKGLRTSLNDYYVGNPQNIENNPTTIKQRTKALFKRSNKNTKKSESKEDK